MKDTQPFQIQGWWNEKKKHEQKKKIPVDILAFTWTRHNEGDIIDLIKIGLWGL